jgi:glycosyltransferase involved in cell wall biosynthesis
MDSILRQKYSNYEYLIIDGASTDRTLDVMKEYEPKFKGRMHWSSEKDAGIYDAMNKGIASANGELIGIINSDDWYEPDCFERIIHAYEKNGEGIYYGILRYMLGKQETLLKRDHHTNLDKGMIQHPTCFITKNIYDRIGVYDTTYRIVADYEFMLRAKNKGMPFYLLDHILANYEESGISVMQEYERIREMLQVQCRYGIRTPAAMRTILMKKKIARFVDKYFLRK